MIMSVFRKLHDFLRSKYERTLANMLITGRDDAPESVTDGLRRYWRRVVTEEVRNSAADYAIVSEGSLTSGSSELATMTFLHRGDTYMALPSVARYLSTMGNVEERTFLARCSMLGLDDFDAVFPYCEGSLVLSRIYRDERRARAAWRSAHQDYEYVQGEVIHPPVTLSLSETPPPEPALDEEVLPVRLTLPPRIPHDHAPYGSRVPNGLPQLNAEWENLLKVLLSRRSVEFDRPKKVRLPPAQPLEVTPVRYEHPRYGRYGHFEYSLKHFTAITWPRKSWVRPTHSTAVAKHVPAVMARWDRHDPFNYMEGTAGRVARDPGTYDRKVMGKFVSLATDLLICKLTEYGMEVHDDLDPTPELAMRWLAKCKFPGPKRQAYCYAFAEAFQDEHHLLPAATMPNVHEVFLKNEGYPAADKVGRCILAGDLHMAAAMAPIVDMLGEAFFNMPYASKRIPERERPYAALDRFGTGTVLLNDMSAFECSISADIKKDIENKVLKYFFPRFSEYIDRSTEPISLSWFGGGARVPNVRCSGDPQTSLGNSMTNLVSIWAAYMYATSIVRQQWCHRDTERVTAWVEGDDSLVSFPELSAPSPALRKHFLRYYKEAFIKMGFATKMELKDFVGDAGYCSMYFTEAGKNSPSVAQTFLDFPWCHGQDQNRGAELLALKACSLAAQAPGQPLTWALSAKYGPKGRGWAVLPFNAYEMEEYERQGFVVTFSGKNMLVEFTSNSGVTAPTPEDRRLFSRRYGISPKDQIFLEGHILQDGCRGILAGHDWSWLAKLCRVDGIDLNACRKIYQDCVGVESPVPGDLSVKYTATSKDGKYVLKKQASKPVVEPTKHEERRSSQRPLRPMRQWKLDEQRRAEIIRKHTHDDPEFAASVAMAKWPILKKRLLWVLCAIAVVAVAPYLYLLRHQILLLVIWALRVVVRIPIACVTFVRWLRQRATPRL